MAEGLAARRFTPHFRFAQGALLGVAVAAIAVAALLAGGHGARNHPDLAWSAWHPNSSDPPIGAIDIANHVASTYKLSDGKELVTVQGGQRLLGSDLKIAVKPRNSTGQVRVLAGVGVLYEMCGSGASCTLPGKATHARALLLQREALELALYSFHYLSGLDQVVTILPPSSAQTSAHAMLFERGDLRAALARPLVRTVPSPPPQLTPAGERQLAGYAPEFAQHLFAVVLEPSSSTSGASYLLLDPTL